ncbi:MAG: hypothetical protein IT479_01055 [Xanthomonadales bacterium]|nr:hypothetical protein [Xanthomonadales bacterium]MCE7931431.1 hypothetical protein [Xanthomonadales bacterium PRO6]
MAALLLGALTLVYPVAVYLSLDRFEPRWLALLLLAIALARLGGGRRDPLAWATAATALALALLSGWFNAWLPVKLYPVAVNALLLVLFGLSLRHPPSFVERLARLQEPQLPAHAVAYTRRVTQVWCGFFVLNGGIALWTALYASHAAWALYNGLLAYLLMGALFAGEWWVRQRVRARHA